MKKAFVIFILIAFYFCGITSQLYAAGNRKSPTQGTVTAKALNIRAKASNRSKIIGGLHKGDLITITSVSGNWYKMTCGSQSGYVHSRYVTVTDSVEVDYSNLTPDEARKVGHSKTKSAHNVKITKFP